MTLRASRLLALSHRLPDVFAHDTRFHVAVPAIAHLTITEAICDNFSFSGRSVAAKGATVVPIGRKCSAWLLSIDSPCRSAAGALMG